MSESKSSLNTFGRIFVFILVLAAVITAVAILIKLYGAFILALLGIGVIVFFHELGHFTVAKLTDINVEAFSVGFPPVLLTIKRIADGYLVKILPGAPKEEGDEPTALLKFTLPAKCEPGETEYRIGMIPFGGFVKMLGQDDTKVVKSSDPRSYSNKRVGIRMAVIVAGVLFNTIFAAAIFMFVFIKGVGLNPPVIGEVLIDSPAYRAGIEPGDEFVMINGRTSNLQFMNIFEAAALSADGKPVPVSIKKRNGSVVNLELTAKKLPSEELKSFGVGIANSLTVAKLSSASAKMFEEKTNLKGGDVIVAVNGKDVNDYFDLIDELKQLYRPSVNLLASRPENNQQSQLIETDIAVEYNPSSIDANSDADLLNICSIVPALKVTYISPNIKYEGEQTLELQDVITRIGDVNFPTYVDVREVTNLHLGKPLDITVIRKNSDGIENELTVKVIPQKESGRTVIGMALGLDLSRPIAAKTVENENITGKLDIKRGSKIISVNGQKTESFFDIIEQISNTAEQEIVFEWQNQQGIIQTAKIQPTGTFDKIVTVKGVLAEGIPFEPLERIYKAKNPITAVVMGFQELSGYLTQAVLTLKQFVSGQVSPKNFLGPVGIVKFSYDIVRNKPLIYYIYFLGLINAFIAVINSVPFLPFDGGHVVLLAIEKITGKPVNERIQTAMVYTGLVLVLAFALYITFNDIVRIIKPPF